MSTTITPVVSSDDIEHLRWLEIAHYIYGGLASLFVLGILAFVGTMSLAGSGSFSSTPAARGAAPLILIGGVFVAFFVLAIPIATMIAGKFIAEHRNRIFCIVISAINCLSAPFGTVLGVFTIIVLVRPSVKAMFDQTNRI